MKKITKKRKRLYIIIAAVLLIFLAIAKKNGLIGGTKSIEVSTEIVEERDIVEIVVASGKIQPEVEIKLSPDVSGEVIELHVKEGDKVKKGDILAVINPELYKSNYDKVVASSNTQKANVANAKARQSQAEASYIQAEQDYNRNLSLRKDKAISESEFQAAEAQYKIAEADLEAAKQNVVAAQYSLMSSMASVKEAQENFSKTTITSPSDGTVSKLNVEIGERVSGASQFSAGTEIMRIANLNSMEVIVSVNENDIIRVKKGDTAFVEVDAYQNRKFNGIVTEIANSANVSGITSDQVTSFDVRIRILQESYADLILEDSSFASPFRPGMSAAVEIQTSKVANVIAVPIQAVTGREDLSAAADSSENSEENTIAQEYVFIYDSGNAVLRKVKTAVQDNQYIQILSGLEKGEEVIVAPYTAIKNTLKDGMQVKKVSQESLYSTP
jgi:HlyD family secretion protein